MNPLASQPRHLHPARHAHPQRLPTYPNLFILSSAALALLSLSTLIFISGVMSLISASLSSRPDTLTPAPTTFPLPPRLLNFPSPRKRCSASSLAILSSSTLFCSRARLCSSSFSRASRSLASERARGAGTREASQA